MPKRTRSERDGASVNSMETLYVRPIRRRRLHYNMTCFGCGARNCPGLNSSARCTRPILCYCCLTHAGHIAKQCPDFVLEPCLQNPDWLREFAQSYGWMPRETRGSVNGWDNRNKTFFLINNKGYKIDIYVTTATVKTVVDHPSRGRNDLFRSGYWCRDKLAKILSDPRVHSGCGYRMRKKAISKCGVCGNFKKKHEFSNHQWSVNRRYPKLPICQHCIPNRPNRSIKTIRFRNTEQDGGNRQRGHQNRKRNYYNNSPPTTEEDLDNMMDGYWARRNTRMETVEDLDNLMDVYWAQRAEA